MLYQLTLFHWNQQQWYTGKTHHGLNLCYKVSNVNIIEAFEISRALETLLIVLEIWKDSFLLVIVYRAPSPVGFFTDGLFFTNCKRFESWSDVIQESC